MPSYPKTGLLSPYHLLLVLICLLEKLDSATKEVILSADALHATHTEPAPPVSYPSVLNLFIRPPFSCTETPERYRISLCSPAWINYVTRNELNSHHLQSDFYILYFAFEENTANRLLVSSCLSSLGCQTEG